MENKMFCFQCEQTAGCAGCTGNMGVCGKSSATAKLQDELTGALIALSKNVDNSTKVEDTTTKLIIEGLFTTVTNVNFNDKTINLLIDKVHKETQRISFSKGLCRSELSYDMSEIWNSNEDIRSLKSLILFGIRGIAAYAYHAMVLWIYK